MATRSGVARSRFSSRIAAKARSRTMRPMGTTRPVASAMGMKASGATRRPSRSLERTRASKPVIDEIPGPGDRLELEEEGVVAQGPVQEPVHLEADRRFAGQLALEGDGLILAAFLGRNQGDVGVTQELRGVGGVMGERRGADTRAQEELVVLRDPVRLPQAGHDLLGQDDARAHVAALEEDGELVGPQPRHQVDRTDE